MMGMKILEGGEGRKQLMAIVEANQLRKTYGDVVAVEHISIHVERGEIFTIIGPNGAGKTTTLEMIEGLLEPDSGDIKIDGMTWRKNREQIKQVIGVQPQSSALFDLLTVYETLDVFASFYKKNTPIAQIIELINLTDHRKKRVKTLSGGQKQRLAIGLALVNDPAIIFLDEPTTGLDPQARRNIWDIVMKLKDIGKTIILTTHYMEEAEKLSDRVCIVDQGKVIAIDTPRKLVQGLSDEREIKLQFMDGAVADDQVLAYVRQLPSVTKCEQDGETIVIRTEVPEETLYRLLQHTNEHKLTLDQISIQDLSLEDVFIAYTGKEWRD